MTDARRCPSCGARNRADAAWCTLCFEPLGAADDVEVDATTTEADATATGYDDATVTSHDDVTPTGHDDSATLVDDETARARQEGAAAAGPQRPPVEPAGAVPMTTSPVPPPPDTLTDDVAAPVTAAAAEDEDTGPPSGPRELRAGAGRFRDTDDGLEWRCATCSEWNPIERVTCAVCRTPFGTAVGAEAPEPRPDVEPALLAGASVLLPGAGHALLRLWGQGFTRAVLALVWGVGGIALLVNARASDQSILPALPLLAGWAVMVVASANDALVEGGSSGRVLLTGRVLLWLVIAVVGATTAAAFIGALSAVSG